MLDTLDRLISISTMGSFNLRICKKSIHFHSYSSLNQISCQPLTGCNYHAGYRIKIKLIYRKNKRSRSSIDLDLHYTRVPSSNSTKNLNYLSSVYIYHTNTTVVGDFINTMRMTFELNFDLN